MITLGNFTFSLSTLFLFAGAILGSGSAVASGDSIFQKPSEIWSLALEREELFSLEDFLESPLFPLREIKKIRALRRSTRHQPSEEGLPRLLLYSEDENLILSFNGGISGSFQEPGEVNSSLDIMLRNSDGKSYDFYFVDFPSNGKSPAVEGPNPEKCIHCHMTRSPMLKEKSPRIFSTEELRRFFRNLSGDDSMPDYARRRYQTLIKSPALHDLFGE